VPLAPVIADALAKLASIRKPTSVTLPWVEQGTRREQREVRLVVPGRSGPRHESVLARAVRELARRAGIDGRVTLHSLRKYYTTVLGDAGVPLKVIDTVTGHESHGLTLGVYTTPTAAGIERSRQAVQDALAPSREDGTRASA